jgi:hypothetical protein
MTDKQFFNKYWSLVCNPNFNLDHLLQMQSEDWEIFYIRHKNFESFVKAKFAHKSNLGKAASVQQLSEENLVLKNQVNEQQQQLANAQDEIN